MQRLLIAVALLLLAPLATAQVYTWKDASGTVHYSQDPPANQATKFKQIKTTGTAAPLASPSHSAKSDDKPADSAPAAAAPKTVANTAANRKQFCAALTANITTLQGSGPVVMQNGGKSTALDAAQRKQQLNAAQGQYKQYCSGN